MKMLILVATGCMAAISSAGVGGMKFLPRWQHTAAPVAIGEKPFVTPADVIPDHAAFTVSATIRLGPWVDRTWIDLFSQRTAQTGWALSGRRAPGIGSDLILEVNGIPYKLTSFVSKDTDVHEWTVTARRGAVVVYKDGEVCGRVFATIVPNLEPIRVGGSGGGKFAPIAGSELVSMRVWDGAEMYLAPGESPDFAGGKVGGRGWMITLPDNAREKRLPGLLCLGDSIMHGYSPLLEKSLGGDSRLYLWSKFFYGLNAETNAVREAVSACLPLEMIVFNNGLHSLHKTWQDASDDQIREVYRQIVRTLREAAPQAKLVYLSTTPHTARKNAQGVVEGFGDLNYMVQRLNRLAASVMEEEGVPQVDAYGLLEHQLSLAAGDCFHWKAEAYRQIADSIVQGFRKSVVSGRK